MQISISATAADGSTKTEQVALEEPLQITLDGCPIAVVMRTPGHDADLVRGFLLTEGIISTPAAIRSIDLDSKANHALVFLTEDAAFDASRLQRNLYSASSCGICGKASIDAILSGFAPLKNPMPFQKSAVLGAPDRLHIAQKTFHSTGGLHAAGLFDRSGELLVLREDVGRHNAVDKVIGHAAADLAESFLLVSGRVSFEIMQKALGAGIPLVAAISAPSSLAVEFATRSNQTLVAFLRPPTFNLYAGTLA